MSESMEIDPRSCPLFHIPIEHISHKRIVIDWSTVIREKWIIWLDPFLADEVLELPGKLTIEWNIPGFLAFQLLIRSGSKIELLDDLNDADRFLERCGL